jgi:hypothetical protein
MDITLNNSRLQERVKEILAPKALAFVEKLQRNSVSLCEGTFAARKLPGQGGSLQPTQPLLLGWLDSTGSP